jgi:hypothetical protein
MYSGKDNEGQLKRGFAEESIKKMAQKTASVQSGLNSQVSPKISFWENNQIGVYCECDEKEY